MINWRLYCLYITFATIHPAYAIDSCGDIFNLKQMTPATPLENRADNLEYKKNCKNQTCWLITEIQSLELNHNNRGQKYPLEISLNFSIRNAILNRVLDSSEIANIKMGKLTLSFLSAYHPGDARQIFLKFGIIPRQINEPNSDTIALRAETAENQIRALQHDAYTKHYSENEYIERSLAILNKIFGESPELVEFAEQKWAPQELAESIIRKNPGINFAYPNFENSALRIFKNKQIGLYPASATALDKDMIEFHINDSLTNELPVSLSYAHHDGSIHVILIVGRREINGKKHFVYLDSNKKGLQMLSSEFIMDSLVTLSIPVQKAKGITNDGPFLVPIIIENP